MSERVNPESSTDETHRSGADTGDSGFTGWAIMIWVAIFFLVVIPFVRSVNVPRQERRSGLQERVHRVTLLIHNHQHFISDRTELEVAGV